MTIHLKRQAAQYRAALRPDVTRPSTRNRLKLLAMACSDHARRLQALLASLETEAEPAAAATYAALAPVVASAQGLASYYPNVHRDWVWGDAENQAAVAAVRLALGSARPQRLLVLGSGAGRLPYDLHAILRPALTVAVDINPLLMAVARRMYAAERVDLYEFPVAPRDLASHALLRALTAPARARAWTAARVRRREAAAVCTGQLRYCRDPVARGRRRHRSRQPCGDRQFAACTGRTLGLHRHAVLSAGRSRAGRTRARKCRKSWRGRASSRPSCRRRASRTWRRRRAGTRGSRRS